MQLRGKQRKCESCGLLMASTSAFKRHRSGDSSHQYRHCLSIPEMLDRGMVIGKDGLWLSKAMPLIPHSSNGR